MMFTLMTAAFMISFTVNRTIKLWSKDDPFFSMLAMAAEENEIDLWQLNFMFAVEKLDPRVGRINAEQVFWGTSVDKEKHKIELVDCKELRPGGTHAGQSNNDGFVLENLDKLRKDFLCPVGLDTMSV